MGGWWYEDCFQLQLLYRIWIWLTLCMDWHMTRRRRWCCHCNVFIFMKRFLLWHAGWCDVMSTSVFTISKLKYIIFVYTISVYELDWSWYLFRDVDFFTIRETWRQTDAMHAYNAFVCYVSRFPFCMAERGKKRGSTA